MNKYCIKNVLLAVDFRMLVLVGGRTVAIELDFRGDFVTNDALKSLRLLFQSIRFLALSMQNKPHGRTTPAGKAATHSAMCHVDLPRTRPHIMVFEACLFCLLGNHLDSPPIRVDPKGCPQKTLTWLLHLVPLCQRVVGQISSEA